MPSHPTKVKIKKVKKPGKRTKKLFGGKKK